MELDAEAPTPYENPVPAACPLELPNEKPPVDPLVSLTLSSATDPKEKPFVPIDAADPPK